LKKEEGWKIPGAEEDLNEQGVVHILGENYVKQEVEDWRRRARGRRIGRG